MGKWLRAARFFKTRSLAARACELGRIKSNGQGAKAAREVRVGDVLQVKSDGGDFQVEVLALSEMRGPAAVAQTLYQETKASLELRLKLTEERKVAGAKLSLHQDRDEKDDWAPIVSVSLGLPAVFMWGGKRRSDRVRRLRLESGDIRCGAVPHASSITVSHRSTMGSIR